MSQTTAPLSYYYHFGACPDELVTFPVREFLDHGISRFVFSDSMIGRALKDPDYLDFLRKLTKDMGVQFVSMHAPFGPHDDLNNPEEAERDEMLKKHIRAMEIAAEFGSKTYTIHVGAYHHCCLDVPLEPLRKYAEAALELLVPAAEKIGIIVAVENSFEPTNAVREILPLVEHFGGHPNIGLCLDTGHANIMAPADWKKPEEYPSWMHSNWHQNFRFEDDAVGKMQKYIVTTHIHDNSGYSDHHGMPGDGTIDWNTLIPKLKNLPNVLEHQTEVTMYPGTSWAGKLFAPPGGYSIKKLVETFRDFGF